MIWNHSGFWVAWWIMVGSKKQLFSRMYVCVCAWFVLFFGGLLTKIMSDLQIVEQMQFVLRTTYSLMLLYNMLICLCSLKCILISVSDICMYLVNYRAPNSQMIVGDWFRSPLSFPMRPQEVCLWVVSLASDRSLVMEPFRGPREWNHGTGDMEVQKHR